MEGRFEMKKTMKSIALVSGSLTFAGGILYSKLSWHFLLPITITSGTIFYHMAVRLLIGFLFDSFLDNQTDVHRKWYQVSTCELAKYEKIGVKNWKQKMPTYDTESFDHTMHSWGEIAKATCQAELVHECNMIVSFVPLFFSIWFGAFPVFLVTSILAALYDSLFVIMQRYNRPRILRLVDKELRRANRRERNLSNEKM